MGTGDRDQAAFVVCEEAQLDHVPVVAVSSAGKGGHPQEEWQSVHASEPTPPEAEADRGPFGGTMSAAHE